MSAPSRDPTEAVILRLTSDLRPMPRLAVARRLALGAGVGALGSLLGVAAVLGLRPDIAQAAAGSMFWMKLTYVLAVGGVALWASERLARPAGEARARIAWLLAPALLVAGLAAWRVAAVPAPMRMPMVMGASAAVCPGTILLTSLPPLAGLVWAVRGLAPTRLALTGLMLGLAAGGAGAAAYALHCPEATMPFLAVWYSLGVAASGLLGALLGRRLLRW